MLTETISQYFSRLGKKGAKARKRKYGKDIYRAMARKRWDAAETKAELSTPRP